MSDFIVDFQGRNTSGAFEQNFLWQGGNVYIMDNHRAALWCWLQKMTAGQKYGLFHIDQHYDTAPVSSFDLASTLPDLAALTIEEYLDLPHPDRGSDSKLISWDNYLYIFNELYLSQVEYFFLATHGDGTPPPDNHNPDEINASHLTFGIRDFLTGSISEQWIVNLDLDYFFASLPGKRALMFSGTYIDEIFGSIKAGLDAKKIACLTVALSPLCTGGWEPAEELCERLTTVLGIDFKLPE